MVLSRDDGLDLIKTKNKMCKIFRENALNITVIPLILIQKPEQQDIIYINNLFVPPTLLKQILSMIIKTIPGTYCDSNHFSKAVLDYKLLFKRMVLIKKIITTKTTDGKKQKEANNLLNVIVSM